MENRPQITRVVLENYKSIAFCDVKLPPLAVLVGPNGTGKSNFLDALRFVSEAVQGTVSGAVGNRGGFNTILKRGSANYLGIRVEFFLPSGRHGYYSIRLTHESLGGAAIAAERCVISGATRAEFRVEKGILQPTASVPDGMEREGLYLPSMSGSSHFKPVYDFLSRFHFYNPNPKDFSQPSSDDELGQPLGASGKNLANVFHRIRIANQVRQLRRERISEYLKAINPEITGITTEALGGFRYLQFQSTNSSDSPFRPNQMSDGTLRSLAILVALFQYADAGARISLVGLEEPESGLHPGAAGVLLDAMREASAGVQVIATTHSADLLDHKDIDADAILAVDSRAGNTQIGPVDQTSRKALRERLYTAGELMRMNYLQPDARPIPEESEIERLLFGDLVPA